MTEDKRKHVRVPITAKVSKISEGEKKFYFTKDLSIGGVYLLTEEDIPIGTILNLEISVQGLKQLLILKGKVVRVEKKEGKTNGVGIQFIDIADEDMENLKTILADS